MIWRNSLLLQSIKMSASLALLGIVNAITIDNQLVLMQNECYERIAIGERIPDQDVYKMANAKTVLDCQFECSKANENCMSVSYGISSNGNTSCILSKKSFKSGSQNQNLYPEDTQRDPDYDLFSKKINCRPKTLPSDHDHQYPNDRNRPNYGPPPYDEQPDMRPPPPSNYGPGAGYGGWNDDRKPLYEDKPRPPIVTHGHDNRGGTVTSIITEIVDPTDPTECCTQTEQTSRNTNSCTSNYAKNSCSSHKFQGLCPNCAKSECNNTTCPYLQQIASSKSDDASQFSSNNSSAAPKRNLNNCPYICPVPESCVPISTVSSYSKLPMKSKDIMQNSTVSCSEPNVDGKLSLNSILELLKKAIGIDGVKIIIKNPDKNDCSTNQEIRVNGNSSRTQKTCKQEIPSSRAEQKESCYENSPICKACGQNFPKCNSLANDIMPQTLCLQSVFEDSDNGPDHVWETASSSAERLSSTCSKCIRTESMDGMFESSIDIKVQQNTDSRVKICEDKNVQHNRELKFEEPAVSVSEKKSQISDTTLKSIIKKASDEITSQKRSPSPNTEIRRPTSKRSPSRRNTSPGKPHRKRSVDTLLQKSSSSKTFKKKISKESVALKSPSKISGDKSQSRLCAAFKSASQNSLDETHPRICAAQINKDETQSKICAALKSESQPSVCAAFRSTSQNTFDETCPKECVASRYIRQWACQESESICPATHPNICPASQSATCSGSDITDVSIYEIQKVGSASQMNICPASHGGTCPGNQTNGIHDTCLIRSLCSPQYRRQDETGSSRRSTSPDKNKEFQSNCSGSKIKIPDGVHGSERTSSLTGRHEEQSNQLLECLCPAEKSKKPDNICRTRTPSPKNVDKIRPTSSGASKYKRSDRSISVDSAKNVSPTRSCVSKSKTPDKTGSSKRQSRSPKNIDEIRSICSGASKYKRSDGNISSRSISLDRAKNIPSTSSCTSKSKTPDETGSSKRQSRSPKNINECRSTSSVSKDKRPIKKTLSGHKSSNRTEKFQPLASSTPKPKRSDVTDSSKRRDSPDKVKVEFQSTSSRSKRPDESTSSRHVSPVKIKEFQPLASSTLKSKRPDEIDSSKSRTSPDRINDFQPTGSSSSKSKRSDEIGRSERSPSPKHINEIQSRSSCATNYKKLDESRISSGSDSKENQSKQLIANKKSETQATQRNADNQPICPADRGSFTSKIGQTQRKSGVPQYNKTNDASKTQRITSLGSTNKSIPCPTETRNISNEIGKSPSRNSETQSTICPASKNRLLYTAKRSASQTSTSEIKPKDSRHKYYECPKNISSKNKPSTKVKSSKNAKHSDISIPTINMSKHRSNKTKSASKTGKPNETINPCETRRSISQNQTCKNKMKSSKNCQISPTRSLSQNTRKSTSRSPAAPKDKCPQINKCKIILELDDIQSPKTCGARGCHQSRISTVRENRCSQLRRNCCTNKAPTTCSARPTTPCTPQKKLTNQEILSRLTENYCAKMEKCKNLSCTNLKLLEEKCKSSERPCSAPNRTRSKSRKVSKPPIPCASRLPANFNSNVALIERRPCSAPPNKACRILTCKPPISPSTIQVRQDPIDPARLRCCQKQELLKNQVPINQVTMDCTKMQSCNRQSCKQALMDPRCVQR